MSSSSSSISRSSACGFRLSAVLGSGATGTVYLGVRDSNNGATAAVKVVDKLKLPVASRSVLAQEAVAMKALNHPSILPMHYQPVLWELPLQPGSRKWQPPHNRS